jgi:serine/threonine protein kinase
MTDIQLENYILDQEIGRGDLTIVYQGRRKSDGATVAVKIVPPQFMFDDYFVRRFLDMAKQAARLEHPNIVRTFVARLEGETLFVARELVDARPLAEVLAEQGPFSAERMLTVARQIASALDYAHQKSVMHGDLSANQVFIGQNDHVTVADFGQTQAMAGTSLVKQGFAVGSPEVMAPERVHGQGPSRQSDLYSLGILCYQMLNGEPPFTGEPAAVLHSQAYEQPRPLHLANPDVSVRLSESIGRMLSKGLELRYTTGSEFTRALTVAAEGTAPVRRASTATSPLDIPDSSSVPIWQRLWFWILVAVPVIVMLLGLGFLVVTASLALLPISRSQAPAPEATVQPAQIVVEAAITETAPVVTAVLQAEPTPSPVAPAATETPVASATPSATPTLVPLPRPGPPVVTADSPFTDLVLSHGIDSNNQPEKVGTSFAPGSQPIYLFFDYRGIEPGTSWTHRWTWGDVELDAYTDTWPDNLFETGTAWVFYSPTGGYQPGPYRVTLAIGGTKVATATFVVEPGGL